MELIWELYKNIAAWGVIIIIGSIILFGGEFNFTIHWNSFTELFKHFKK